ncbi:MAG TPA: hypothetical protein VFM38_12800 [Candidatus Limnocylindrales bacterium]|nr:hypothetical protein [Candidatus Limnocylindrales bacterium]
MIVGLLIAIVAVGVMAPVSAFAASPSTGVPKVVLIVGPAGAATDRYRAQARAAASLARQYTPDVTEIYSPFATWPAVKRALQGASVVVYMGHGNGWPSPYRDALYPPTQNGFGLNPTAGGGDGTHQYFGEARIAQSVRLAPNAVVLLNHLCYASGNSEPGLAEGTLAVAKQRVDNFAAGFVTAGASAVIAEAHDDPDHMLRAVLAGRGGIESAWRHAPAANGNSFGFESSRSPGYVAEMDPEHRDRGFTRSIVLKKGLASGDVLRSAQGRTTGASTVVPAAALVPSLVGTGLTLKTPLLRSTMAGRTLWYRIPYAMADRDRLPDGIEASVRWDPLDPPAGGTAPADPTTPPDFGLVTPERLGDVVAPIALTVDSKSLSVRVKAPATPGRYRLTVMLHDKDGVAYDTATQAEVAPLIVRLTGPNDAAVSAPANLALEPGAAPTLDLWVTNLGNAAWGSKAVAGTTAKGRKPIGALPATHAQLIGTWVPLGVADQRQIDPAAAASVRPAELPAAFSPRAVAPAGLTVFAPIAEGDYLLIIDVVTPEAGSLAAQGVEPTIIRVHVAEPPASASPTPVASPTPAASPTAVASPPAATSPAPSTPSLAPQPED